MNPNQKSTIEHMWTNILSVAAVTLVMSCVVELPENDDVVVRPLTVENASIIGFTGSMGSRDGVLIRDGQCVEQLYFELIHPLGYPINTNEISFYYRKKIEDSVVVDYHIDYCDSCQRQGYFLNSFSVIEGCSERVAVFFTFDDLYPSPGLDPRSINMYVYYNEDLYKWTGKIPHISEEWDEIYRCNPDLNLSEASPVIFNLVHEEWENYMESMRRIMPSHY